MGNGGAFFDSHIISFIEPQAGRLIRVHVRRRDGKLGIGLNDANEVLDLPPAELCDGELKVFDRVLSIDEVVIGPRKLVDVLRDLPVQEKHELRCVRWGDAPAPPVRDPETGAMLNAVAVRNLVDNQAAIAPEVDAAEWRARVMLAVREARNSEVAARRYLRADHRHRTNQAEVKKATEARARRRRARARRSQRRRRASVSKRLARGAARRTSRFRATAQIATRGARPRRRRSARRGSRRWRRRRCESCRRRARAGRGARASTAAAAGGGGATTRRSRGRQRKGRRSCAAHRRARLDPEAATAALANLLADPEERLSTNFADEVRAGEGVPMYVMAGLRRPWCTTTPASAGGATGVVTAGTEESPTTPAPPSSAENSFVAAEGHFARGGAYADAPPPPPSADGSFKAMTRHSRPENDRSLFVAAMTVAAATPAEGAASSAAEEFLDLHEFGAVPAPAPAPAAPRAPEPARHLTNVRMSRRRQPAADGQLARGVSAADAAAARLPDPMRFIQPTPAPPPPPGGDRHVERRPAKRRTWRAASTPPMRRRRVRRTRCASPHADILLPVEPDSLPPPMPELHLARGLELGQTTAPRADRSGTWTRTLCRRCPPTRCRRRCPSCIWRAGSSSGRARRRAPTRSASCGPDPWCGFRFW